MWWARIARGVSVAAAALVLASAAQAATIRVTTKRDETAVDGNCSLREATIAANKDRKVDACAKGSGADTIVVRAGTYKIALAPSVGSDRDAGDFDITAPVTIRGSGAGKTIVDGAGLDGVFDLQVNSTHPVTIAGVTIQHGSNGGAGGGLYVAGTAPVRLVRTVVSSNSSKDGGGGIYVNGANVRLTLSAVDDNTAATTHGDGGGIENEVGTVGLDRTTVAGNSAPLAPGGGIWNDGTLNVTRSSIHENTGTNGDGIYNTGSNGTATIKNSTIAQNGVNHGTDRGGGIFNNGNLALVNDTLALNAANVNGGGDEYYGSSGSSATTKDTIFFGDDQCEGPVLFTSLGHNLENSPAVSCFANDDPTNMAAADLKLGPLASNGGPTETMALLAGSPAIDAGAGCAGPDQRGAPRPGALTPGETAGSACDIGAYERARCDGVLVNIVGGAGADVLTGTPGADGVLGLAGADRINPGGGSDGVCAGLGNDRVALKDGAKDRANGGPGTDTASSHDAGLDVLQSFEVVH
jgi:predicted outer membrane repeat protein